MRSDDKTTAMEIRFYRDEPLSREARSLPAEDYNLTRLLLARASAGCVFVPIRSMQVLAVIDAEEIIFTHREAAREVEIAWTRFRPDERSRLDEPVGFEALYYQPGARETMSRLQGDFLKALRLMAERQAPKTDAHVLAFPAVNKTGQN
jgi:hypothetical protein